MTVLRRIPPFTSSFAHGADVPIPTLTELSPSTREFEADTIAFAPIAVAFVRVAPDPPALYPSAVLYVPVVFPEKD